MTARIAGQSQHVPSPAGPYSSCVRIGSMIAASGQAGFGPDGALLAGVGAQVGQTLRNLQHALESHGASLSDALHVRVYLTDPGHFDEMNQEYAQHFAEPYPARTTVFVQLPGEILAEIDVLAVVEQER